MTLDEMRKTITGLDNNEPEKTNGELIIMPKAEIVRELEKAKAAKAKREDEAEAAKLIINFKEQLDVMLVCGFSVGRSNAYIERIMKILAVK